MDEVEEKIKTFGLEMVAKELIYLAHRDVPDSVLIVCTRKEEEHVQRMA